MDDKDKNQGPATNISELTLVCLDLAMKIEEAATEEEKFSCIQDHIVKYTENQIPMTEFETGLEWFNVSRSLNVSKDLKGRISVLDFFTYCCINCMHILPDLEALEEQHPPENGEVLVVGVHSAKFENERVSANIVAAVKKYHIHHPVVNDPQAKMWTQLGISCWPTLLILGPTGQPLFVLVGEGHRQRLQLYVTTAVQYFSSLKVLTRMAVPVSPSMHISATDSNLLYPGKVAIYPGGIIVADSGNNRILLLDKEGVVKKVVGSGSQGFDNGSFKEASFNNPQGIIYHHPNTIYVADTANHAVRKIDLVLEEVETFVGTGKQGFDFDGGQDRSCQAISSPWDLCLTRSLDLQDAEENLLLIAMAGTHQIWGVFLSQGKWFKGSSYSKGTTVRLAGSGAEENRNTSYPLRAGFAQPSGICIGVHCGQPVVYIADAESSSIRKFSLADGAVKGVVGAARDPLDLFAYGDVDGTGIDAKLQHPLGVASYNESVFVVDSYNHKIKVVKPSGKLFTLTTVAGSGKPGNVVGDAADALFNEPGGLCFSEEDVCLYIADTNNHSIKVFSLKNNSVSQITVKIGDEIDSQSQDIISTDSDIEEILVEVLPECEVKAHLRLQLALPLGMSVNKEAPNMWRMYTEDPQITMASTEGKLLETTNMEVTLFFTNLESSESVLHINSVIYVCLESGVCMKKNLKCDVKFMILDSNVTEVSEDINVDIVLKVKKSEKDV